MSHPIYEFVLFYSIAESLTKANHDKIVYSITKNKINFLEKMLIKYIDKLCKV